MDIINPDFADHCMNLHKKPFELIRSGKKTIELRLYDRKRRKIKVGDIIQFTNSTDPNEKIFVTVNSIHIYPTFKELYEELPLEKCGYSKEELPDASYTDMYEYYTQSQQEKCGVVGIEISLKDSV